MASQAELEDMAFDRIMAEVTEGTRGRDASTVLHSDLDRGTQADIARHVVLGNQCLTASVHQPGSKGLGSGVAGEPAEGRDLCIPDEVDDSAKREAIIAARIAANRAAAVARKAAKDEARARCSRKAAKCGFDQAEVGRTYDETDLGHDHVGWSLEPP